MKLLHAYYWNTVPNMCETFTLMEMSACFNNFEHQYAKHTKICHHLNKYPFHKVHRCMAPIHTDPSFEIPICKVTAHIPKGPAVYRFQIQNRNLFTFMTQYRVLLCLNA